MVDIVVHRPVELFGVKGGPQDGGRQIGQTRADYAFDGAEPRLRAGARSPERHYPYVEVAVGQVAGKAMGLVEVPKEPVRGEAVA